MLADKKSCMAAAARQCRSHLWKSETSAFLSPHQTKTVPVRRFFYEIFYWQGLLKQPEPDTQESPISTPPVKKAVSQQAVASTLLPLGEDVSKCQHMQTPVERTWKLTASFLGPTFNNAYLLWDQQCGSVSESSEIGRARLSPPSSWWNRLGSLCSLSNRLPLDRQAASLAEWQKFGTAWPDSLSPSDRHWWEMSVWAQSFKMDLNKRNVEKKSRPRCVWTPAAQVSYRHTVVLYLFPPPQLFSFVTRVQGRLLSS